MPGPHPLQSGQFGQSGDSTYLSYTVDAYTGVGTAFPVFKSRFKDNAYLGEVAATDSFLAPLLGPLLDEPRAGGRGNRAGHDARCRSAGGGVRR